MSILDYFPRGLIPREVQRKALLTIEKEWKNTDVFILNLPVSSGKSYIAYTIQNWLGRGSSAILTNNNILVEQYKKDFPFLVAAYGKSAVKCLNTAEPNSEFKSCQERYEWASKAKARKYCPNCPYFKINKRFYSRSKFNYITV